LAQVAGTKITNSIGMTFVYIKPGTFMMGSPSGEPGRFDKETQHQVTLTKGFYMGKTEVTVGQWRAFIKDAGYKTEAETRGDEYAWISLSERIYWDNPGFAQLDNHPVTCVSWNDAQAFIKWLNRKDGSRYRLPTEAEWEYAARAGSKSAFSGGEITKTDCTHDPILDDLGWYCGNARGKTHPVAQKNANSWGLYDMQGNVWEWCQDRYGDYPSGSVTDPAGPLSGQFRVFRGGSGFFSAMYCRSASRDGNSPGERNGGLGFRLSMTRGNN